MEDRETIWSGEQLEKFSKMCSLLKKYDIYHHHVVGMRVTIVLHLSFPQMCAGWLCWSIPSKLWDGLAS